MTDRELLELAARAAGYEIHVWGTRGQENIARMDLPNRPRWNPLTNDGDALRLAVKLRMDVAIGQSIKAVCSLGESFSRSVVAIEEAPYAATRRAIVRAAAEIGKMMK